MKEATKAQRLANVVAWRESRSLNVWEVKADRIVEDFRERQAEREYNPTAERQEEMERTVPSKRPFLPVALILESDVEYCRVMRETFARVHAGLLSPKRASDVQSFQRKEAIRRYRAAHAARFEAYGHSTWTNQPFGQGVMFVGQLLAYAAMDEGLHVTWIPSYGPEMRGGTAHCFVVINDKPIGSPIVRTPKTAVAFNSPSFEKYETLVAPGGLLAITTPNYDSLSRIALGSEWAVLSPREHLYYFTAATIDRLLAETGFRHVEHLAPQPGYGPIQTLNGAHSWSPSSLRTRLYSLLSKPLARVSFQR